MQEKMKVILDSDPGHDDAVAILLAGKAPTIELLGVSSCSGNQSIEKTTRNALNLCQYLDIDVPVAQGSPRPLVREPMYCPQIHGESGLDGFTFPPLTKKKDSRSGADFIIDTCLANEDVILVPTGPLTNIAMALTKKPEIKSHIKEIMMMGGSMGVGNVTPAGEFNIVADPEAAAIVFGSGLPIYMNGLDVTRQVLISDQLIERMGKIGNKASDLFVKLMRVYNANQKKTFQWKNGAPIHDPVTVVSLLDPGVVTYESMNVDIDVSKGPSYGRTNCDRYGYLHLKPNAFVAVAINPDRFWDVVEKVMRLY